MQRLEKQPTQGELIKAEIIKLLDSGNKDKSDIFSRVVRETRLPRPTVRRVAGQLRDEMRAKVQILEQDMVDNHGV